MDLKTICVCVREREIMKFYFMDVKSIYMCVCVDINRYIDIPQVKNPRVPLEHAFG
jgi:hypothetical protein